MVGSEGQGDLGDSWGQRHLQDLGGQNTFKRSMRSGRSGRFLRSGMSHTSKRYRRSRRSRRHGRFRKYSFKFPCLCIFSGLKPSVLYSARARGGSSLDERT